MITVRLLLTGALIAAFTLGVAEAASGDHLDGTPQHGVFYGTELDDPERSAYLVVVGEADALGLVTTFWVDFATDGCTTGSDRRPIVTAGVGELTIRPNGVQLIDSLIFQTSHCVNNEQIRHQDLPVNFRYDPVTDTLKQTVANGGPATLHRICDGSGFGGTGKNRYKSVVTGTDGRDRLVGTAARDLIDARAGNDVVLAGSGNDVICVGEGTNTVRAGKGFDILVGDRGIDTLRGGEGQDLLLGWAHNDTLEGENGNDLLFGLTGSDQLFGGSGNDSLYPEIGLADGGPGPADYCRGQITFDIFESCEDLETF